MKRPYRILTMFAMNCAGIGAYHLVSGPEGQPDLHAAEVMHEQEMQPEGFAMIGVAIEEKVSATPSSPPRPTTTIDLNTPDLARQARLTDTSRDGRGEVGADTTSPTTGSDEQKAKELPEKEPPRVLLPEVTLPEPEVVLPPEMAVELGMANEPFPIPPKPDYVKFVISPDGETANGFLEQGNRISIAESLLPEMPSAYQLLPYASNLHKLHDFPGFCSVLAHAAREDDSLLWLPVLSTPKNPDLHDISQAVASPTIQRLISTGKISPVQLPGWDIQSWVICSDRTVDGQAPFSTPRAITWLGGIHLVDGHPVEGEKSNG